MSDRLSDTEVLDRCFALISSNAAYSEALSELTNAPSKNRRTGTAGLERDLAMEQALMQPSASSQTHSLIDIMNEALLKVLADKHGSSDGQALAIGGDEEEDSTNSTDSSSHPNLLKRKWKTHLKDRARLHGFALGMESATLSTFQCTTPSELGRLSADQERRLSNLMSTVRPPLLYSAKKGDAWNSVLDKGQFYYFEEMGNLRAGAHAIADMNDVWELLIEHPNATDELKKASSGSGPTFSVQQELAAANHGDKKRRSTLQLCWNIIHHFARREETPEAERLHQGQYILSQVSGQNKKATAAAPPTSTPPAAPLGSSSSGSASFDAWLGARQFSRNTIPRSLRPSFYSYFLNGTAAADGGVSGESGIVPWELALAYEAHSVAQLQDYFIFSDSIRQALFSVYKANSGNGNDASSKVRVPVLGAALRMAPLAFLFSDGGKLSQAAKSMDDALWNPLFSFTGLSNRGIAETDLGDLLSAFERLAWDVAPSAAQNCVRLGVQAANLFLPLIGASFVPFLTPTEVLTIWDLVFGWNSAAPLAVVAAAIFLHVSPQLASARTVSELRMPLLTHEADCVPCEAAAQCADDMSYRLRGLVSELRRRLNRVDYGTK